HSTRYRHEQDPGVSPGGLFGVDQEISAVRRTWWAWWRYRRFRPRLIALRSPSRQTSFRACSTASSSRPFLVVTRAGMVSIGSNMGPDPVSSVLLYLLLYGHDGHV